MKFEVSLKGETYLIEVERCTPASVEEFTALGGGKKEIVTEEAQVASVAVPSGSANTVNAPLPGAIVAVKVAVGQAVKKGQLVALLEAMKMENEIVAPYDGTVKTIVAPKGTTVAVGDPIIELN